MEIKTVKKIAITIHGEGGYKLHLLIYSIYLSKSRKFCMYT